MKRLRSPYGLSLAPEAAPSPPISKSPIQLQRNAELNETSVPTIPPPAVPQPPTSRASTPTSNAPASPSARRWDRKVVAWESQIHSGSGLEAVRDALLERAAPEANDRCVDLGAGTGFVTLPLAAQTRSVLAVDHAPAMLDRLTAQATQGHRIQTQVCDLSRFDLPEASVELVVSNYALHHLSHQQKLALVRRSRHWLVPGGRIVIADMMLGRGLNKNDRTIIAAKVRALAQKGARGWWRIAKNAVRLGFGVGSERPATPQFWIDALRDAGFVDVTFERLVAESGVVSARRPLEPAATVPPSGSSAR